MHTKKTNEPATVFLCDIHFDASMNIAEALPKLPRGTKHPAVTRNNMSTNISSKNFFVAGDVPGTVTVEITTKNNVTLGKTQFTYVNQHKETMKQIAKSKSLQAQLFKMLSEQYENDESKESDTQIYGEFKHFPLLSLLVSA